MKKTTQLKRMILGSSLDFILEAHNGISAKIVEEAGFKGIWGSGLAISASLGVRDNNEASWTQILDVLEFMSDATKIPILLDGDTGYGNFNNMRRLVMKLEQREVGGVCIEDKIFPKTNSFLRAEQQPLADIDEFCGKIKAGKDSQKDDDFVIVARVEALIAGWGLREALKRAEAYRQAGADAILIHSKRSSSEEIFSFLKEWDNRAPVVLVPTKYYTTPTDDFRKHKVSVVIWANHLIRGAVEKMQTVAGLIHSERNLLSVEDKVVPVKELFRLQDDAEMAEAEERYLKKKPGSSASAVILAATQGSQLGDLTEHIPKTMLKIGKRTILERTVDNLRDYGIGDITVVAGFAHRTIDYPNIAVVVNENHKTSGQMLSLSLATPTFKTDTLVLFGDILFRKYILQFAIEDPADIVLIVDSSAKTRMTGKSDFVRADSPDNHSFFGEDSYVERIDFDRPDKKYDGEWIGIMKLSPKGTQLMADYIERRKRSPQFHTLDLRDMINEFVEAGVKVKIQYISGHWVDVNHVSDLTLASEF